MKRTIPALCLTLSWVAGCAGAAPAPTPHEEVDALERRIHDEELELAAAELDCTAGCRGTASICDAADRICEIVAERTDEDLGPRCERARGACQAARDRVATGCACQSSSGGAAEPL